VEPLVGDVIVAATDRRTKIDFAHFIRGLCDGPYRDAEKLVLVMDNLNTHSPASLYEAFPPAEARRIVERLSWRFKTEDARIKLRRLYPTWEEDK